MDSTASDPQPHQLQAPPPAPVTASSSSSSTTPSSQSSQIPAQNQHYHQQQPLPPPQQHQPKTHQNQQTHHQHPAHQHQHSHHPLHHATASTQQANFQYTQGPCIRASCVYGPPYTHTTQYPHYITNFPVPQPQQLTTTVVQHMQSPVPHSVYNKSSTSMINPVLVTDRLHNQNLQSATSHNQVATTKDPQERKKAVLKDPNTMKEIPWDSSKSTASSTTKETTNTSTPPATTIASGEHITTFLQKVSETTNSEGTNNNKQQNKRPQQQNKKPTIVSNVAEEKQINSEAFPSINATIASEKAPVPNTTSSTKITNIKSAATANINTNNLNTTGAAPTATITSTATTTTPSTTTETTPSVPQLTNKNNEKPLKTEQHNVNKSGEAKTPQSVAVQQPAHTLLQKVSEDCLDSSPPTYNGQGSPKDKKVIETTNNDDQRELQNPPSFPATSSPKSPAIVSDKDEDNDGNKENENKTDCEKLNGDAITKVEKSEEEDKEVSNDSKTDDDKKEKDSEKVTLKYEPGQYNPISNKDGKKIYSRQFLLDVKEYIRDTLEPERELESYDRNSQVDFFCPQFSAGGQRLNSTNRQNEPARRQSQYNYAGRSSAGQEKQRKVITSVSLTQEVELKTTSNPWRPTKEIKEDVPNNVTETESLKKKFRSILNKLTPDNFENLKKAVTELDINTESNLGEVIDIVFAKALAEPGYCVLYGQMCSHLKKITAGTANFGTILLQRCQQQFQSDIYSGLNLKERKENIENEQSPDVKKHLNEELYEDMFRSRMRGLGLIKFIGELYKIEMLNDQIMFDCVIRLLSDTSEESLECLCDLLATIGEKLDRSTSQKVAEKEKKAPRSASKANAYQGGQKSAAAVVASGSTSSQQQKAAQQQQVSVTTLDQVFEQLHKIRKNKDLPLAVRIRFKLLDTCELREKYNWQSKKTKDNNPKKTKEIREAHQEKLEKERQQNAMGPRRSQEGRRGLGHSGGSSSQLSSLANESGGNRGKLNMHTSSSSHLLRDPSLGDNMKTNHTDIDAIKEHQRKLEGFKGITTLANTSKSPSDDQTLRLGPPTTFLRPLFRPTPNPSPVGRSAVSTTTTPSSTAAEPAQK